MRGNARPATARSSAAIASPPATAAGTVARAGSATLNTAAQPNDSARCTGTAAAASTPACRSRGSRIDPAAVTPSSSDSPRASVTTVDGAPLSSAPASPAGSASASATFRGVPDAYVALLLIHLHFPDSGSLKTKRKDLSSVKAQLHGRHGVTVAEVDGQDTWQRATLAAALTGGSLSVLEASVDRVERFLLDRFPECVRVERSLTSFEDAGGLG
jgi:uncharacterized protein